MSNQGHTQYSDFSIPYKGRRAGKSPAGENFPA